MSKQNADIWEQKKREYFAKRFSVLLDTWKKKEKAKGKNGTQEEFAERIEVGSVNSISNYKKGRDFPSPETMEKICKEFGVKEEIFYPLFNFERGGDYSYHEESEKKLHEHCLSIGLNESLVSFITTVKSVQDVFPLHTYRNYPNNEFPIIKTESPFQITDGNGTTLFLDPSDLDYLKQLQNEIESFIRFKFFEEKQSLRKKHIDYYIGIFTSHTDLQREQILSKCDFSETSLSDMEKVYREDEKAIQKAVLAIQEDRGERIHFHWKQSDIDKLFSSFEESISPVLNQYSDVSMDELEKFYQECDKFQSEQKEKYTNAILQNGGVIENG